MLLRWETTHTEQGTYVAVITDPCNLHINIAPVEVSHSAEKNPLIWTKLPDTVTLHSCNNYTTSSVGTET